VAVAYGRIWSLMPASAYQPSWSATKNAVWSVLGVQSRARRTVAGLATGVDDGDAGADGADDDGADGAAELVALGRGV
jgi:hypothetical protein